MNDIDLLQKIPKEHYTLHENKLCKVGDLLNILKDKYNDEKLLRQNTKRRIHKVSSVRKTKNIL